MRKEEVDMRLEEELLDRIRLLEENNHEIKRICRRDYIVAGVIITVCFLLVVLGAFI